MGMKRPPCAYCSMAGTRKYLLVNSGEIIAACVNHLKQAQAAQAVDLKK